MHELPPPHEVTHERTLRHAVLEKHAFACEQQLSRRHASQADLPDEPLSEHVLGPGPASVEVEVLLPKPPSAALTHASTSAQAFAAHARAPVSALSL